MKTKIFFLLTAIVALLSAFMGLTQAAAFVIGRDDPRVTSPRTNGILLGSHYSSGRTRGYIGSRSIRATAFRGGGPGVGK